jgi:hypothetical protein
VSEYLVCEDDGGEVWRIGSRLYSVRWQSNGASFHRLTKSFRWDRRHHGFSGGASWLTGEGYRLLKDPTDASK